MSYKSCSQLNDDEIIHIEPHELEQLNLVCNFIQNDHHVMKKIVIHEAMNGQQALNMFKSC